MHAYNPLRSTNRSQRIAVTLQPTYQKRPRTMVTIQYISFQPSFYSCFHWLTNYIQAGPQFRGFSCCSCSTWSTTSRSNSSIRRILINRQVASHLSNGSAIHIHSLSLSAHGFCRVLKVFPSILSFPVDLTMWFSVTFTLSGLME